MGKQTANKRRAPRNQPTGKENKRTVLDAARQKTPFNFLAVRPALYRIEDERRHESRVVDDTPLTYGRGRKVLSRWKKQPIT